ncbi:CpaF family protein [Alteromonas sp. ASW11-19]|uniref:CpaF family protein n=1 Tax=Alteromonas salexigens TaxID=2982530 RepID=A0ABT2VNP9_9ALTE|nr:CpaF family protein [Alteromonas salexigens]MCU7554869.1 CpaF family protein [Alteromonas salexigens]
MDGEQHFIDPYEQLTSADIDTKQEVFSEVLNMLDPSMLEKIEETTARQQITECCRKLLENYPRPINMATREVITRLVLDEILGLGPLEVLMSDTSISDILVNNFNNIYVERAGKLERAAVRFYDNRHLLSIIDRIVSRIGRRVDESSPMVDARLEDGSRVNAIIPPLALDGPSLSIRRFTVEKLTVAQLIDYGSMTADMDTLLKGAVKGKLNVLISGGTGSGKTTLLNIVSSYIPGDERIITIEDSAELQLQQPHTVRLETRPPNIEGKGEVTQRDLVKNCLRMRPDRIVIGEVRGAEAIDMLAAMNTGHEGSLATLHANSPRDALGRLENMICMGGFDMPVRNIRAQIASAIDLVIQTQRLEDGSRRIISIQEVTGMEGETITMSELFKFERHGLTRDNKVDGNFKATGVVPLFHRKLVAMGIEMPHKIFGVDKEIFF